MLKSAIRRKVEKCIRATNCISLEIDELKIKNDNVKELSSVVDSFEKANRAYKLAAQELSSCLLRLPEPKREIVIGVIK